MGVLRIDHPDIEEFIFSKQNSTSLTAFNISVAVTDEFMDAVRDGKNFDLRHGGTVYKTIQARYLWNELMRSTWDWAEPGILFIDRINEMNNLWYCEIISATNPCAEQPLPPYGACLLGSFNLTKYIVDTPSGREFNYDLFRRDIPVVVRAMDNVVDRAIYPLPQQEAEAKAKRRMGLGITGAANAIESLGFPYGTDGYVAVQGMILRTLRDECYKASVELAKEKGAFPLFDRAKYVSGEFVMTLPTDIQRSISSDGIRNSHLLSIAPTGTISLSADNVSSGIEPVFAYKTERTIINEDGVSTRTVQIEDYGYKYFGVCGRTVDDLGVDEHVRVLTAAQTYIDSAISKTCNVSDDVTFEQFKDVYWKAYEGGAKGCTTFRAAGKRFGILKAVKEDEAVACTIDPMTGAKSCG
jgi:ribonucleoside-diphosphate reductase alpha chain